MSRSCILGRAAAGRDEDLAKDRGFPEIIVEGFRACTARVRLAMSLRSLGDTIAMLPCSAANRRAAARASTAAVSTAASTVASTAVSSAVLRTVSVCRRKPKTEKCAAAVFVLLSVLYRSSVSTTVLQFHFLSNRHNMVPAARCRCVLTANSRNSYNFQRAF